MLNCMSLFVERVPGFTSLQASSDRLRFWLQQQFHDTVMCLFTSIFSAKCHSYVHAGPNVMGYWPLGLLTLVVYW